MHTRTFWILAVAWIALFGRPTASQAGEGPTYAQVRQWIAEYKAAHPGRDGKDWDINAKSPEEIASEPDTRRLCELCGPDRRPVIPELAWEYGGSDHRWEDPQRAALVYCVPTPVAKSSPYWRYDAARKRVMAHVYVLFPEHDPCASKSASEQADSCIGGFGNLEILSDTATRNDGRDVGLDLAETETELRLRLPNGKSVRLALIR
jgi:hypothetical protein